MFELNYIFVIHGLKKLSLLFEQFDALFVQCLALDHLHSYFFICLFVNGTVDCAKCAFSKKTLKLVMLWIGLAWLKLAKIAGDLLGLRRCHSLTYYHFIFSFLLCCDFRACLISLVISYHSYISLELLWIFVTIFQTSNRQSCTVRLFRVACVIVI